MLKDLIVKLTEENEIIIMNEICVYEISACHLRATIIPIIKMHNNISIKLDYVSIKFARSSLILREQIYSLN